MPFTPSTLYPILDAAFMPPEEARRAQWLERTIIALHDAGVTVVQLREKGCSLNRILRDAATLRHAAPAGMQLILNDDPNAAYQAGFDGVHLGQEDGSVERARAILGPDAIVGVSTHSVAQLAAADRTRATYLAIGPVFCTATKPDAEAVVGLHGVRAARALTQKTLVAIGGISAGTAPSVHAAGADAVAVIGALLREPSRSPGEIAQDFLRGMR